MITAQYQFRAVTAGVRMNLQHLQIFQAYISSSRYFFETYVGVDELSLGLGSKSMAARSRVANLNRTMNNGIWINTKNCDTFSIPFDIYCHLP